MNPKPGKYKEFFDEKSPPSAHSEKEESSELKTIQPALKVWGLGRDAIAAICLGILCFLVLFITLDDYGITWDEAAPNFVAARNQAEWFRNLGNSNILFPRKPLINIGPAFYSSFTDPNPDGNILPYIRALDR